MNHPNANNTDFICQQCRNYVSADAGLARAQNRNHCPYCLHSRHLDQFVPGDRLAYCMGLMRPIGLTVKRTTKKYASSLGELMLIHHCLTCGKLSANRIAADDIADFIIEVFHASQRLPPEVTAQVFSSQITLLGAQDAPLVQARLFGLVTA